jgi:hypothetical protein
MVTVSRCKELVCHRQMALVPKLFEQTTDASFVLVRHGGSLFMKARYSSLASGELGLSDLLETAGVLGI